MKAALQYVASAFFVLAGIALLCAPARSEAPFVPTRFTVVDAGTVGKPDVVLIPGLTSSREVWAAEAKLLAPNYRLHLLQVNGFAGAPAGVNATGEILPAIVDELHGYIATLPAKPVVMGHSLGGLLTLELALKYPEDARKLVIVDSLPFYAAVFGASSVAEVHPRAEAMRGMLTQQTAEQREAGAKMTAEMLAIDPEGRKLVQKNSLDSDRAVFAEAMYEDLTTDLRGEVGKIKTPMLMVYPYDAKGEPDAAKIDGVYQEAYKPMPNVKLVRVDDARHFVMLDQPAKFDEVLEGWLK